MNDRHTVDSINDDQLDQLYDDLARAETENAELRDALAHCPEREPRQRAEAAIERVRTLAGRIRQGVPWTANDDDIAAHILQALDGPAAEQPARTTATNPPGSTAEQLPAEILDLLPGKPYLSTACDTAQQLAEVPLRVGGTSQRRSGVNIAWLAGPMHGRCRLNHKFTGALCICPCHPEERQT